MALIPMAMACSRVFGRIWASLLQGSHVVLVGAGGAARAAAVQCLLGGCERLYLGNCSLERLEAVLSVLSHLPGGVGEKVKTFELSSRLPTCRTPESS